MDTEKPAKSDNIPEILIDSFTVAPSSPVTHSSGDGGSTSKSSEESISNVVSRSQPLYTCCVRVWPRETISNADLTDTPEASESTPEHAFETPAGGAITQDPTEILEHQRPYQIGIVGNLTGN